MIHLDTSVLVAALTGERRLHGALRDVIDAGEPIAISTIVLFEWLRGPRRETELRVQEELLPTDAAVPFGGVEATIAAELSRIVRRVRGRQAHLMIAATTLSHDASLWTMNVEDFADLPALRLHAPAA